MSNFHGMQQDDPGIFLKNPSSQQALFGPASLQDLLADRNFQLTVRVSLNSHYLVSIFVFHLVLSVVSPYRAHDTLSCKTGVHNVNSFILSRTLMPRKTKPV